MEIILYFLGAGLVIAFVMLLLDTQQSRRVSKIVKDTKNVQPLFLQRSAEQKLNTLNVLLYGDPANNQHLPKSKQIILNEDARQLLSAQLNELIEQYKRGKINLNAYHGELNDMLSMTYEISQVSFERAKYATID